MQVTEGSSTATNSVAADAPRSHLAPIASAVALYVAAILCYHPFADLTYGGDDFAYAWTAYRLVLDGKLIAASWSNAACVPQMVWGALFAKIFGLSFRTLNLATMVAGAFGPALIYGLALALGTRRRNAMLVTLFCVLNPLYLGFSTSFMSDGYYTVLLLATAYVYALGLRRRSIPLLVLGSVAASVALLERQIGFVTPVALVGALVLAVLTKRRTLQRGAFEACAAAVLPCASALVFRTFPDRFGGVTPTQLVKLNPVAVMTRLKDVGLSLTSTYTTLVYLSVFLVPLVVAFWPAFLGQLAAIRTRAGRATAGVLVSVSLLCFALGLSGKLDQILPGEFLHPNAIAPFALNLWRGLAFVGSIVLPLVAVGFTISTKNALLARAGSDSDGDALLVRVFLALTLILHTLLVVTFISFFNNYFAPLVPLVLLLAGTLFPEPASNTPSRVLLLPAAALLFVFVWSVLNLDQLFRFVEADQRFTDRVIAEGTPSALVFDYEGSFGRRNYQLIDAEITKDPWAAFPVLRRRSKVVIIGAGIPVPRAFTQLLRTEPYSTLAGTRALELRGRAVRKPARH